MQGCWVVHPGLDSARAQMRGQPIAFGPITAADYI